MSDFWTERIETPATVDDWHVFLIVHRSDESYESDSVGIERLFLTQQRGRKTYVMAKSCILSPRVTLTAVIDPKPKGKEIGRIVASEWEGMDMVEIGRAQAWYYRRNQLEAISRCGKRLKTHWYSGSTRGWLLHQLGNPSTRKITGRRF